jgi:hypothetical protein
MLALAGTHDVLRVELSDAEVASAGEGTSSSSRTVLLPFAAAIVPEVDRKGRLMKVAPPAGLLELVSSSPSKSNNKARTRRNMPITRRNKSKEIQVKVVEE